MWFTSSFHVQPSGYVYSALECNVQCSYTLCHIVGSPPSTPLLQPPPPPPPPQAARPQNYAQPQTGDSIGHFGCFSNLILISNYVAVRSKSHGELLQQSCLEYMAKLC